MTMPIGELHRYKYTQLGKGILFQPDVYVEYGKFEQVISHFRNRSCTVHTRPRGLGGAGENDFWGGVEISADIWHFYLKNHFFTILKLF